MEDPWGYNAWSSTPAHNPIVNDQEHDVSNTLNAPTWNNSGISWNSNDAVAGVDDGWGGSTMFASIGAALGTRDNSSENVNESPVEEKPEAKEEEVVHMTRRTHGEVDNDDLASIPFSPGLPSTPPVLPHEEHGEEKLDEPVDESDPWGTGTSFLPPASTSSTSPFGIPAVKLDDAFPSQDIGRPFGEEDPAAVEFEPPPPLPTSLDDVPSLSQPIPSIPEPPTDDWGHDTHNAWGPPVSPTNDVEFEDEPEDEWSRAVKQREKQDALVPPEKLSAIVEDAKILFGPPMSPPLPPTSKLRSSKSYASDTTLANDEAEFNWRVAPDELSSRVQTTLDIIQTNPTPSKSSPPPASKSVSVAEDVDPWAARDQGSLSGTTVATPSTSLTLPILPPFPQTSTFKSFQTSLKLTRNTPVSRSSVFSQFITQPTSSQFEKWESSLRMKKELTTEEMDEAKTTNTKKGGGLFSSLFGGGSSTKPMPGFGSNSPMPPSAATSNRPSVERTGSTPRTSVSVDRTASSSPAPVISPIVTTASSTTPIPSPSKSKPTPAPLPEITGSLFDTPETKTNGSSPTTQEPEQPESGGAVSRKEARCNSPPDDLEFLSDTAGDGSVGRYTDAKDDALFSLSGALESDAKPSSVTIPQPPPTKLPIPDAPSLPTLMMGAPGMLASSSSGALATGLGFSVPPAGHLDDGEEDDFAALEPTLSKSPPPIAEHSMMDQFDMLFGGPPAPPSPQRPPAQTSGFKPPPPSSYVPSPAAVTPPVQSKYVPPAHLASAAVPKTKKPIPVARMSSSSSPTTSNPSAFPVVRMSSSGPAKPLAAPGIGNGFSLPPPPGGVKVATSGPSSPANALPPPVPLASSSSSPPPLSPPTNGFTSVLIDSICVLIFHNGVFGFG
ncbi:hypothetical protein DL96DRAFT_1704456 [Flagelloscypha sp. PMI_526]|nr:hypothetical protein DL96DRAFT_1704456 [Flagelloscypha sp. PMI_526]